LGSQRLPISTRDYLPREFASEMFLPTLNHAASSAVRDGNRSAAWISASIDGRVLSGDVFRRASREKH
jgi:hypothetical protein